MIFAIVLFIVACLIGPGGYSVVRGARADAVVDVERADVCALVIADVKRKLIHRYAFGCTSGQQPSLGPMS